MRARGIGNGLVFPAGPLRAPLAAQIALRRCARRARRRDGRQGGEDGGARRASDAARPHRAGAPPRPEAAALSGLRRHRRPGEVLRRRWPRPAPTIGHTMDFPDHHLFTRCRLRGDPGGGEEPGSRADHHREGPRAAEPPRRRGRAAGGGDGDVSGAHPLRGAAAADRADRRTRSPPTAAPIGAQPSSRRGGATAPA